MRTFEYLMMPVEGDTAIVEQGLNRLGAQGWELVSSVSVEDSHDRFVLFFKRDVVAAHLSDLPAALDMVSEGGPAP